MAFVRTFQGYRPVPRLDGVKWTALDIYESASPDGPWVTPIDTQVVANYADAAAPPTLSFTTDDAVLETGWYRVRFRDPAAGVSWTQPEAHGVAGVLLPPTPTEVRQRSAYLETAVPLADAGKMERLRQAVLDAIGLVKSLTCRDVTVSTGDEYLDRVAFRAVLLKTERLIAGEGTAKTRGGDLGSVRLRSFTAGPYSESYFGPDEAAKAGVLDPDPALHEALWAITSEECRAEWLVLWGKAGQPPFAAVQPFDYSGQTARSMDWWGFPGRGF